MTPCASAKEKSRQSIRAKACHKSPLGRQARQRHIPDQFLHPVLRFFMKLRWAGFVIQVYLPLAHPASDDVIPRLIHLGRHRLLVSGATSAQRNKERHAISRSIFRTAMSYQNLSAHSGCKIQLLRTNLPVLFESAACPTQVSKLLLGDYLPLLDLGSRMECISLKKSLLCYMRPGPSIRRLLAGNAFFQRPCFA